MKRIRFYSLAVLAALASFASCKKEVAPEVVDPVLEPEQPAVVAPVQPYDITVSIPKDMTKVDLSQDPADIKTGGILLAWHEGDQITITDGAKLATFTYKEKVGDDDKVAVFTTTDPLPDGGSYTISYTNLPGTFAEQTQSADANTEHLRYAATLSGVNTFEDIVFSETWASEKGGSFTQSSVLRLRAKLPAGAAAHVNSVVIKAFKADGTDLELVDGGNSLTINITPGDVSETDVIRVYATLPAQTISIPANSSFLFKFNTDGTSPYQSVYTHYRTLPTADSFAMGNANYFNLNCSNTPSYAGSGDDGSAEHPYLIGDKYQLAAVEAKLSTTVKYFKLVDDITLDAGWTSMNSDGTKVINLDGNGKTIRNLDAPLFDDFNGQVQNLKIDNATVNGGNNATGIFANTIKTAASTVDNVDINNSSVVATAYTGALICNITAANSTITNVDITDTNVTGTLAGGIIGFPQVVTSITNCHFEGNGTSSDAATKGVITANNQYAGGIMAATTANKAVTISDCTVMAAKIVSSYNRVGGAIGHLRSASSIEKSTVGSETKPVFIEIPSTGQYVGGFIGYCEGGPVNECTALTKISASTNNIGGFVGYVNTTSSFAGCKVLSGSSVTGNENVGGFAGQVTSGTFSGTRSGNNAHSTCESSGNITATGNNTGGFVGSATGGSFTCCDATGTVESSGINVGGFVGSSAGSLHYSYCRYWGTNVSTSCTTPNDVNLGGFCGGISEAFTGSFSKCWVSQGSSGLKVNSSKNKNRVGGFIGSVGTYVGANNTGTIEKCRVHKATITGGTYTGGFAGVSGISFSQCGVSGGSVTATSYAVGGFVGYQRTDSGSQSIENCYVTITPVKSTNNNKVGGMAGYNKNTSYTNCYVGAVQIVYSSTSNGLFIGDANTSTATSGCICWSSTTGLTWFGDNTKCSTSADNYHIKQSEDTYISSWATTFSWSTGIWNIPNNSNNVTLKEADTIMPI